MTTSIPTASESGHAAYVGDYLVGRIDNIAYAIDADGVLTVALIAPQSKARLRVKLCPRKMSAHRRRLPAPAVPVDPIVEAVCGMKVPPGQYHVFLFSGEPCAI
jgi:hypothetical protein